MPIGNPVTLTSNVASKAISVTATASQTLFNVTGGYRINELGVFKNGLRLQDGVDYTARDGLTVTLLSAASGGDKLQFVVFDTFRVAEAIRPAVDEQTIRGNLNVVGILSCTDLEGPVSLNITSGIQTFHDVRVGGALTVAGALTFDDVTNVDSVGYATFRSGINVQGAGSTTTTLNVTGVSTIAGSVSIGNSIFHLGDTNTAFGFPAADTFTVYTAGSERFRVKSDSQLLHTRTDDTTRYDLEFRNTGSINDGNYGGLHWTQDSTGSTNLAALEIAYASSGRPDIVFKTRDSGETTISEVLRINSDGDVGIGTSVPTEKLHVFNRTSNGGLIHYDGASNGHFGLRIRSNSDGGNFESDFGNGTTAMLDLFADASTVSGGDFLVCRSQAAIPILLVKGNGRVGVGTAVPAGVFQIEAASTADMIMLNAGGTNFAKLGHNSASGVDVLDVRSEGHMRFLTNGNNERFRITNGGTIYTTNATAAGSLGVGTDSPGVASGMSRYLTLSAAAADNAVGFELQGNRSGNDEPVGRISFINRTSECARITVDSDASGTESAGNMLFATGGSTEKMRISSDGLVGIATAVPEAQLTVKGDGNIGAKDFKYEFSNTHGIQIKGGESALDIVSSDDGSHGGSILIRTSNDGFGMHFNPTKDQLIFNYTVPSADGFDINAGSNTSTNTEVLIIGKTGICTATQLFEGSTRVATTGKAIAMAMLFG